MKNKKYRLKKWTKARIYALAAVLALIAIILIAQTTRVQAIPDPEFTITDFSTENDEYEFDCYEEVDITWSIDGNWTRCFVIWGDGTPNEWISNLTTSATHSYSREGRYNVTLWVEDRWGNTDKKSLPELITIKNDPPTFDIDLNKNEVWEDEDVVISIDNLVDSDYDIDNAVHMFIFDTGDNTEQVHTSETSITHTYTEAGRYPITVTCFDDQLALKQKTTYIEAKNKAPVADIQLGGEPPATFSFADDIIGRVPFKWQEVVPTTRDAIKIIDNQGTMMRVLEVSGNPGFPEPSIKTNVGTQSFGTVEYYFMTENSTNAIGYLSFKSGGTEAFAVYPKSEKWKYRVDGSEYDVQGCGTPQNNTFHHIRIDFKGTGTYMGLGNQKFRVIVDGVSSSEDYGFAASGVSSVDNLVIGALVNEKSKAFVDSIGCSWDPNYEIGSNYNFFEESYYGTYDFRSDVVGTDPKGFDVMDTAPSSSQPYYGTFDFEGDQTGNHRLPSGWSYKEYYSTAFNNIIQRSSANGIVTELYDHNDEDEVAIYDLLGSRSSGTVEFYVWIDSNSEYHTDYGGTTFSLEQEQADDYKVKLRFGDDGNNKIEYKRHGMEYQEVCSISDRNWVHIRLDFECSSGEYKGLSDDSFNLYVNGIKKISNGYMDATSITYVDAITLGTSGKRTGIARYDAFGYSWDNNYEIGDNLGTGLDVSIVDQNGYYKEAVRFTDKKTDDEVWIENDFEDQTSGTIEWYVKSSDVSDKIWAMHFMDDIQTEFSVLMDNNKWQYAIGANYFDITGVGTPSNDKFYHIRVDFDCSTDKFKVFINDTESNEYDFNGEQINKIRFETGQNAEGIAWLDALGYSFDDLYEIGMNKIPLVSYPEKTKVLFSAADTVDTESDIESMSFVWQFGDGATDCGKYVEHTYLTSGVYCVNLTAQDDNGATDSCTKIVLIHNTYPDLNIVSSDHNITINEGETIVFNTETFDDLSDWARLSYSWGRDGGEFDPFNPSTYANAGWKASQIFKDDWDGNVYALVEDPEGASDSDLVGIHVENVDPLISIWDANVLADASFEVYRNSVNKEANFTFEVVANDDEEFSEHITFEGSEENSVVSNKTSLAMTLSKVWRVKVNSTELPTNSWFKSYVRLRFLDGRELVLSSPKIYGDGSNHGYHEFELNPHWFDSSSYTFMYPITLNATTFDPSLDNLNVTVNYSVNSLIEINCTDSLPIQDSFTEEYSFGTVNYTVEVFEDNNKIYVNITANYLIMEDSYGNNTFPVNLDFSYTIYPIVDLIDFLEERLNLTELSILNCVDASNWLIAGVVDDDGGSSELTVLFTTQDGIEFQNLSPKLDAYIQNFGTTVHEITFFASISDFDQIFSLTDYSVADFKSYYVPEEADFTLTNGTLDKYDDLKYQDSVSSEFTAENSYLANHGDITFYNGTAETVGEYQNIDGNYTVIKDSSFVLGNYYASYSNGAEWDSWVETETGSAVVTRETMYQGHYDVIHIDDNNVAGGCGISKTELSEITTDIEIWYYPDENYRGYLYWYTSTTTDVIVIQFYETDDTIRYYDGSLHTIYNDYDEQWYHIYLDVDWDNNQYDFYLDGTYIDTCDFVNSANSINRFNTVSGHSHTADNYIDALGYTAYSNYTLGDNRNPIPTKVNFTSKIQFDDGGETINALSLEYSLKCNVSTPVEVRVFNFNTSQWDLIDNSTYSSFETVFKTLSNAYWNSTNDVLINFYAEKSDEEFELYLEKLKVNLKVALNFTVSLKLDLEQEQVIKYLKLVYGYGSKFSQLINLILYNYTGQSWVLLDSSTVNGNWYKNKYSVLSSEFISEENELLAKIEAENDTVGVEFYLDQFRLEYYSAYSSDLNYFEFFNVPDPPGDFSLTGNSNWEGDLTSQDYDYAEFIPDVFRRIAKSDDFAFYKGSLDIYGDLTKLDGNFTSIDSSDYLAYAEGSFIMQPNGDHYITWSGATLHYSRVDEWYYGGPLDGQTIYTTGNAFDQFYMTDPVLEEGAKVSTVRMWLCSRKWLGDGKRISVNPYFPSSGWLSAKTINPSTSYTYQYKEWTGLDLDQEDINGTIVSLYGYNTGWAFVEIVFVHAFWERDAAPAVLNFTSEIEFEGDLDNSVLHYSYKTDISQPVDFCIWNDEIGQWDLIDDSNYDSFADHYFELNESYRYQNNKVLVRFFGSNSEQDFELQVDMLCINEFLLELIADFKMNGIAPNDKLESLKLLYSCKTNVSQVVDIYLYNYTSDQFVLVDSSTRFEFANETYSIPIEMSDFYNEYFGTKAKIRAINDSAFEFDLDKLKLEYSWEKSREKPIYDDVPDPPNDFSNITGSSDWAGDLAKENDYTTFNSSNFKANFTTTFDMEHVDVGDRVDSIDFMCRYKTNQSQVVDLFLYNFTSSSWVLINSNSNTDFFAFSYSIPLVRYEQVLVIVNQTVNYTDTVKYCDFFDSGYQVKVKLEAINSTENFELYLDQLKIIYTYTPYYFVSNPIRTKIEAIDGDYSVFDSISTNIYRASYTFDENMDGWVKIDPENTEVYWSDDTKDGHKGIVKMKDYDDDEDCSLYRTFGSRTSGVVSFWLRGTDVSEGLEIRFYQGSYKKIYMAINGDDLDYKHGDDWDKIYDFPGDNIWYYIKIDFNCGTDTFDIWIDGVQRGNNLGFYDDASYLGRLLFMTGRTQQGYKYYYDAVNFHWENDYDNSVPNHLLNQTFTLELEEMNRFRSFKSAEIQYRFKTNLEENVSVNIFDYNANDWVEIEEILTDTEDFYGNSFTFNTTDFFNSKYEVLIMFAGYRESTSGFELHLKDLNVTYQWKDVIANYGYDNNLDELNHVANMSSEYNYWYSSNHTFDCQGEFLVTMTADDGFSTTKSGEVINITNRVPWGKIGNFPNATTEDELVRFTSKVGNLNSIISNSSLRFMWNFGDGNLAFDKNPEHKYSKSGVYNITLFIQDQFGNTFTDLKNITVLETPPEIRGPFSFQGLEGQAITLEVEAYDSYLDDLTLQYRWYNSTAQSSEYKFSTDRKPVVLLEEGKYNYSLQVEDSNGQVAAKNITIFVDNYAPTVLLSSYAYSGAPGDGQHNGDDEAGKLTLTAYGFDSFEDTNELDFYWTIFETDNEIYTAHAYNQDTSHTINYKVESTMVYKVHVKVVDSSGMAGFGTTTISSFIDSNSNGVSNEFEAHLELHNQNITQYSDADGDQLLDFYEMGVSNTSYLDVDTDGDGLWDGYNNETGIGETKLGTDPRMWTSDNDWLSDGFEFFGWNITTEMTGTIHVDSNPLVSDTDNDGLDDYDEYLAGSDPRNPDTDNDKLLDGEDPYPIKIDGDEDGLTDYEEVQLGTNTNETDTDGDGIGDGSEVRGWGMGFITNPLSQDTDHDFIGDGAELTTYKYEIEDKKQLKRPVSLTFEENCKNVDAAQIAFIITFGEFNESADNGAGYGTENVPDLEIEIYKKEENLRLFNFTSNGTAQRYVSQVVDIRDVIDKMNLTESFNYKGTYVIKINDTSTSALLEQFEIEASRYLDPCDDDFDNDDIMDGVECAYFVEGEYTIDFADSYWYDNLTVNEYNVNNTITEEFWLEIPQIGRVDDADLKISLENDAAPQGPYEESDLGDIKVKLIKEEIDGRIDDAILVDNSYEIYNNWTYQSWYDPIELDLTDYLNNGSISEYYGNYQLLIEITTTEYYYANNICNFTLAEYYIIVDSWREPQDLSEWDAWITDPLTDDTDNDDISDYDEIYGWWGPDNVKTNPVSPDTDGDGTWDSKDTDPTHNLIVEIEFLRARDYDDERIVGFLKDTEDDRLRLQGIISFEYNGMLMSYCTLPTKAYHKEKTFTTDDEEEYRFDEEAVFEDNEEYEDDGCVFYFDVDDEQESVDFSYQVWHRPKDEQLNYRILNERNVEFDLLEDYDYNSEIETEYEDDDAMIEVKLTTKAVEKANTIAIYEKNDTSFNGHYREKQKLTVVELFVNDNPSSGSPFVEGSNAIVLSTALFANTKLNGYVQRGEIESTKLYKEDCFEFGSAARNHDSNSDGATNYVDAVLIRKEISPIDAEEVLNDLLLTCVVNETYDNSTKELSVETEVLYAYICTKLDDVRAVDMNLPSDAIKTIPWENVFENSDAGEIPFYTDYNPYDWLDEEGEEDQEDNVIIRFGKAVLDQWKRSDYTGDPGYDLGRQIGQDGGIDVLYDLYGMVAPYIRVVGEWIDIVIAYIIVAIMYLVMLILTYLGDFLWLIIRAILLGLIYIMLAIEIITTVPIYFAIGVALSVLGDFSDMNSHYNVQWWCEYSKDTCIALVSLGVDEFSVQIESWINWKYWRYFDLYFPVLDTDFKMDDISYSDPDLEDEIIPPNLHCNFDQIGNTSSYDFSTTYSNEYEPEYVKLRLFSPKNNFYTYSMQKRSEGYDDYEDGVEYNKTIDFETEFTENERKGQWFYSFEAKNDPDEGDGKVFKWPLYNTGAHYQPGPYLGDLKPYLFYTMPRDLSGWEFDEFTINVTGCELIDGLVPESVNLTVLLPDGSFDTFEMTEVNSFAYDTIDEDSALFNKTFTTYSVSLDFSDYFDFENDTYVFYYFDALLSDGNRSILFNRDDFTNTFYDIFVRSVADDGHTPKIVNYRVEELVWPRSWNYDDVLSPLSVFLPFLPNYEVIQPICSEHVMRYWVWVRDPDGSHEDTYEWNDEEFEFIPKLTLTRISDDLEVELDMAWYGYDEDLQADMYYVDLSTLGGVGVYSYEWDEYWNCDWAPGAWEISFEITDNCSNTDTLDALHKIWFTGSFERMRSTAFGGASLVQSDNPWLSSFGTYKSIIVMVLMMAAATAAIAKRYTIARVIAAGVAITDLVYTVLGFLSFLNEGDPGAMLGLFLNMLLSSVMFLIVKQISSLKNMFKASMGLNFLKKFAKISALISLALMLYMDPLKILTLELIPGNPGFLFFGERPDGLPDLDMPYEDLAKTPMDLAMFFVTNLGLGFILNFIGGSKQESKFTGIGAMGNSGGFLAGLSTTGQRPVTKILGFYTGFTIMMSMLCLETFLRNTGYYHIAPGLLSSFLAKGTGIITDPFQDPPMDVYYVEEGDEN